MFKVQLMHTLDEYERTINRLMRIKHSRSPGALESKDIFNRYLQENGGCLKTTNLCIFKVVVLNFI